MANSAPAKVLIVGYGDLGSEVARQLALEGLNVTGVRRSSNVSADHSGSNAVQIIAADVTKPESLTALNAVQPDFVIYTVAASGQTDAEYKSAYVDGLRNVLATQKNNTHLRHVFFVSSTRVYGQDTESLLDESALALPADFGGRRLLEAEHMLQTLSCGHTALRLSGIYGPGRLRMINLAKSPDSWPKQNAWSNRIHRDDAAAFMVFLMKQVLAGKSAQNCYIVTDSRPVPQYEILSWLATQQQMSKPKQLQVCGGKRLSNKVMLETGFKLQYPDYKAGYRKLLPV